MQILLPLRPPGGAMLYDPVEQCLFKPDVMAGFFALQPLVTKDLFPFREEFFVEQRFFHKIRVFVRLGAHGVRKIHFIKSSVNARGG
jgi:hypothetical protein